MGVRARGRIALAGGIAAVLAAGFAASALGFFSLDPGFGNEGVVRTPGPGGSSDEPVGVEMLAGGKILVGGDMTTTAGGRDFALVRYDEDGDPDPTFGGDGIVTTDIGATSSDRAADMTVQDDGKILLTGFTRANEPGADTDMAVVRYNADGTLDSSFDGPSTSGNGIVVLPRSATLDDSADAVAVDGAGRTLLAGSLDLVDDPLEQDTEIVRLTTTGDLDDTFDTDGGKSISFGGTEAREGASDVDLLDDGDVLVAGYVFPDVGTGGWAFARLNEAGTLDESFDGPGPAEGNGTFMIENDGGVSKVAISTDKIAVAGTPGWTIARLSQSDGDYDTTFGSDGTVTTDFGQGFNPDVNDIRVDGTGYVTSGRVIPASDNDQLTTVVRYLSSGDTDDAVGPDGILMRNLVPEDPDALGFEAGRAIAVADDANATTTNPVVTAGQGWYGTSVQQSDYTVARFADDVFEPVTTITSPKRKKSRKRRQTLRFSANEPATFSCQLDSRPVIEDCESGRSFRLRVGRHKFRVTGTDESGNVETTPAVRRIKILPRRR